MFGRHAQEDLISRFVHHEKKSDVDVSVKLSCTKQWARLWIAEQDLYDILRSPPPRNPPSDSPLCFRNETNKRVFSPEEHAHWAASQQHQFQEEEQLGLKCRTRKRTLFQCLKYCNLKNSKIAIWNYQLLLAKLLLMKPM